VRRPVPAAVENLEQPIKELNRAARLKLRHPHTSTSLPAAAPYHRLQRSVPRVSLVTRRQRSLVAGSACVHPGGAILRQNAVMAVVVRIDRWECIGILVGLKGPLPAGAHGCMFDAWRYPDGRLRHEPPPLPSTATGPLDRPALVKLGVPVHDPAAPDLELMASPTYLDFIIHHPAFHRFPPRPWRGNPLRLLAAKMRRNRR
jgi:hypothetical protein